VDRIGRTARAMVDGDFSARIPIERVETEFGQLARALNDAFDRLHASLERQRRFTADASHELRTPLATLSTEVQWALARPRDSDEYRRSLEASQRAARRMQAVVERLLALARDVAGADVDQAVEVRLRDLVQRVADDLAPLAMTRGIAVDVTGDPVTVTGDPDRLVDAFTNVLANAIQYNIEGGRVTIAVRHDAHHAEVTVADTGTGIAPDDVPRVFEPFFRADPARQHDEGGAGLGLTVAQTILRRHGGDVTITSEPGRGTIVVLRLPARRSLPH
jgi:two-component system, OmpR family, sensor kinase